jgi:heme oxygenase (biliverdin-producing, ferredoxin)
MTQSSQFTLSREIFLITGEMTNISLYIIAFTFNLLLSSSLGFHHVLITRKSATSSSSQRAFDGELRARIRHRATAMSATPDTSIASDTTTSKPVSFVTDVMRPYAMKLHTRDQAPKEGKQAPQTPFTAWEPSRQGYLRFLVDSLAVYEALEAIVEGNPQLSGLRNTGLERSKELKEDIAWILTYDKTLEPSVCGPYGEAYAKFLHQVAQESIPRFVCHFYNQYFAHTAGGLMIGKRMSDKLLEGKTLKFYTWTVPDVKVLLDQTRKEIDKLAATWTEKEKQVCLEETMACFGYSGSLFAYVKPPMPGSAH